MRAPTDNLHRPLTSRRAVLLAALVALLSSTADLQAAPARDLERFREIVRLPLDGVPLGATVEGRLDAVHAEAVVTVGAALAERFQKKLERTVQRRGGTVVTDVFAAREAGTTELRFLLSTPAVEVQVTKSSRRRRWFVEVYTLRHVAPLPGLAPLPVFRYAGPDGIHALTPGHASAGEAGRQAYADLEDALIRGDVKAGERAMEARRSG